MRRLALILAGLVSLAWLSTAWPARTAVWTETPEHLKRGEADGVALTQQGAMFPAPRLNGLRPPSGKNIPAGLLSAGEQRHGLWLWNNWLGIVGEVF